MSGITVYIFRREALFNMRRQRRYTCYALDEPVLVGGGIPRDWNDDGDFGLEVCEVYSEYKDEI